MDKEWLKYWQKIEDLEINEDEENSDVNSKEEEKIEYLKEAKDLYKSVLNDNN